MTDTIESRYDYSFYLGNEHNPQVIAVGAVRADSLQEAIFKAIASEPHYAINPYILLAVTPTKRIFIS